MPTKKKKAPSHKTTQAQYLKKLFFDPKTFSRTSTVTKVICVVISLIVVYFLVAGIKFVTGKAGQHDLALRVNYVQEQLSSTLGRPVTMTQKKSCFYNEQQGDFDKGRLWCGVEINGSYTATNGEDLGKTQLSIQKVAKERQAFGTFSVDSPTTGSDRTYRGKTGICDLRFNVGLYDYSSQVPVKTGFRLACSTRSSYQYYPLEGY